MGRVLSKLLWFALGVVLALILLEIVLRFMPVAMGMHRTSDHARWPLQNTEPHLHYTYSRGWSMENPQHGTTNNYGQVSPFDYRRDRRPVIVIGDSYVESLMNPYADTLQAQLAQRMGSADAVYGLGVSGLSASDYVALSRLARDEFAPSAAVFLFTDGDLSESLFARTGNYSLSRAGKSFKLNYEPMRGESMATKLRRVIGDLSLHRYLQSNLQFSLSPLWEHFQRRGIPSQTQSSEPVLRPFEDIEMQKKVADWFLAELSGSLSLPAECVVVLVDTDRYGIYKPDLASPRKDSSAARQYLIERAEALGYRVADLDPVFRRHYAKEQAKFDHWPTDRHWNRLGYTIGAEEALRLLYRHTAPQGRACLADARPWN